MRRTIWDKKIPTLLGIILISGGIFMTTMLTRSGVIFQSKAGPTQIPQQVRLSNISDSSFTVTYTTATPILGSVKYGTNATFGSTALDDRDQQKGTVTPFVTHYITVKNVRPSTKYLFAIVSGDNTYDNNGQPFEVTTAPQITTKPPQQNPLAGKVSLSNGSPANGTILTMIVPGSQMFSTLVTNDGTYLLPLNALLTSNLSTYYSIKPTDVINMTLTNGSESSTVKLLATQTNPVPLITLSQNYDFVSSQQPLNEQTNANQSAQALFPVFNQVSTQSQTPKIIIPGKKDEGFADQQPTFQGSAPPNTDIQITIHSVEQIQVTVRTNKNGVWSYRPIKRLSPGAHTISITAKDASGIQRTVSQTFIIYAAGSQVSESATPSATIVPTLRPTATVAPTIVPTVNPTSSLTPTPTTTGSATLTPTTTPVVTATPSATIIPTPTAIPTVAPTVTPIPTAIPPIVQNNPPPQMHPGSDSFVLFGFVAMIATAIGIILFLTARSSSL